MLYLYPSYAHGVLDPVYIKRASAAIISQIQEKLSILGQGKYPVSLKTELKPAQSKPGCSA